ncbi:conserved hypothetical protein [Agrobacterium deltaense Zutra 3/1]|uniref:Uncharacterized protein n=1 Tax=Agrobacterium deltaense Zutra 3/1 TaxID=1183427 RepID=A0A1S7QJT4_9HYPH|nr:conserved hypothetical protein [Agrobacterium deltaense Zutra 3/1]
MRGLALDLSLALAPSSRCRDLLPLGEKKYAALARSIFPLCFSARMDEPFPPVTTAILFDRNQFAFQVNC